MRAGWVRPVQSLTVGGLILRLLTALLAATVLAGLACTKESNGAETPPKPTPAAETTQITEEIASPAGPGAAEPFLSTTRDSLLLSWLEPVVNTDRVALRFARYRNGKWSPSQTIVERNDLFVNWADFPSIVEDAKGTLFTQWLQKSGSGTYSYDVWMATSTDGKKWGKPFLLNRDGTQTEHGFVTLAVLPGSGVGATWLDGRKMKAGGDHEAAGHDAGGDMTIRYAVVSASGEISQDVELDNRTCECCTTGMTVTSAGPLIAYRDRTKGEIRDISVVRRNSSGWTKPTPLYTDGWKVNGCPVNGPQLDSIGDRVVSAWFTAAKDRGRVKASFSEDGGTTFGKPMAIDDGKPVGRVDVLMLNPEAAIVTWVEQTAGGAEIRARLIRPNGKVDPSVKIADSSTARAAGFPRTAKLGKDPYFAWTEQTATSKRIHIARRSF